MTTFVRVRDAAGNEFSIPEDSPYLTADLTVLDEPAAYDHGAALPPKVAEPATTTKKQTRTAHTATED